MLPPPFERQMLELLGPGRICFLSGRFKCPAARQHTAEGFCHLHPIGPAERIPWHPSGWYLPERPVFTLDPAFHAGAYYVQEASSMFLYEVLKQSVNFPNRLKVLDLCAAPGGKSTLVADMLPPGSLLVANEVIRPRVGILRENMEK